MLKKEGILSVFYKIKKYLQQWKYRNISYKQWIETFENYNTSSCRADSKVKKEVLSIILCSNSHSSQYMKDSILSVLSQTNSNWELILVITQKSIGNEILESIKEIELTKDIELSKEMKRSKDIELAHEQKFNNKECYIKLIQGEVCHTIAELKNLGVDEAQGDFVTFLKEGDRLSNQAVDNVLKCIRENKDVDYIYSDEDSFYEMDGEKDKKVIRVHPFFKPDWSPDTLLSFPYTGHLSIYRRSLIQFISGFHKELNHYEDYDLTLRLTEKTSNIHHISKILYHVRILSESDLGVTIYEKDYLETLRTIKEKTILRRGYTGELEIIFKGEGLSKNKKLDELSQWQQFGLIFKPKQDTLVSIIIPSKDNFQLLKKCISSIMNYTQKEDYEIVVVDNGSENSEKAHYEELLNDVGGTYVYHPMDFNFSVMCNIGASYAKGNLLLFLNDDIEVKTKDWLTRMSGQAQLSHVGAVGAKLYYPNSDILQHCGIAMKSYGPVHMLSGESDSQDIYFGKNRMVYNYSAVTGACLMVRADKFWKVHGFDDRLAIGYNDVDLCLKLLEAGFFNCLRNDVIHEHHEYFSRGNDFLNHNKAKRLYMELNYLRKKHSYIYFKDPFYNSNLSPYGLGYQYNYINKADIVHPIKLRENERKIIAEYPLIENSDDLDVLIQNVLLNNWVKIHGWFLENRGDGRSYRGSNRRKAKASIYNRMKFLILRDITTNTIMYRIPIKIDYISELVYRYSNKRNGRCGIRACFKINDMLPGTYELGVVVDRRVYYTSEIISNI